MATINRAKKKQSKSALQPSKNKQRTNNVVIECNGLLTQIANSNDYKLFDKPLSSLNCRFYNEYKKVVNNPICFGKL